MTFLTIENYHLKLKTNHLHIIIYYYYYYNSSIALNLKQYYSKRFTVHNIQYTCTIKHISRIDTMR